MPQIFFQKTLFEDVFKKSQETKSEVVDEDMVKIINDFNLILKPFILKRSKNVIFKELPEKEEIFLYTGLSTEQKELY